MMLGLIVLTSASTAASVRTRGGSAPPLSGTTATTSRASAAKTILWTLCDDADSLGAASSWMLNASSLQLVLAGDPPSDAGHANGADKRLCLTHPGPEVPTAWGPHLVAQACDAAAANQRWAWKGQMLQYMGEPSSAAVCIQADATSPWINAPAATWPCPPNATWNTAIARLHSTNVSGAIKLQLNMRVHKLCLSYATSSPPSPPPPLSPPLCRAYGSKAVCGAHDSRCQWADGECAARLATPSQEQLEWQDYEMGALLTFNIGEYGELTNTYACGNASAPMPPASAFNPAQLNATEWMNSVRDYGGRYAVLTVQAGCGFDLWPSNVSFPATLGGGLYNYTVRESPFKRDLLREFVDAARAAGIRPGIYYIVNNNVLLERIYNATAAEKENIILGQLREIWSSYGELVELWFDGGTQDPVLGSKIPPLLQELQPKAVCFQGPTKTQAVRWAGSESGHAILPNWSASKGSTDYGSGEATGPVFAPTEADVTLSVDGSWYWRPGQAIKTLDYLTSLHDASVGHNANLLLNFSPTYSGRLPAEGVAMYKLFGDWRRACYGEHNKINDTAAPPPPSGRRTQVGVPLAVGTPLKLEATVGPGGRVVIMEDQTMGQRIVNYTLEGRLAPTGSVLDSQPHPSSHTPQEVSGNMKERWVQIVNAQSIGHKRIVVLPNSTQTFDVLQLTVLQVAGADGASIRSFAAYGAAKCAVPSTPPHAPCSLEEDYVFTGDVSKTIAGSKDVAACCSACRSVPAKACVAFSRSQAGVCTLFKALGGGSKESGATSGSPIWN